MWIILWTEKSIQAIFSNPAPNHPAPDLPVPLAGYIPQEEIQTSLTAKACAIDVTDPGLWNVKNTKTVHYWIRVWLTSSCQNHDCKFSNSHRVHDQVEEEEPRYLSKIEFKSELQNGECVKQKWLLYTPSQGRLCCFACHLLSKKESTFATLWLKTQ